MKENPENFSPIETNKADLSPQEEIAAPMSSPQNTPPKRKRNFTWGAAKIFLSIFFIGYGINWLRFSFFSGLADCGKISEESVGKYELNSINRTQEYYFLKNQKFAKNTKSLPYVFQPDNKHFSYSMQATNQAVFSYAIAHPNAYTVGTEYFGLFWWDVQESPPFKSSVGAVFAVPTNKIDSKTKQKQMTTISIVCDSLQPGATTLMPPKLVKAIPTCGAGTKK